MANRPATELRGRDVVVVGASAGGVEALKGLAAGLPRGLPVALLVVLHMPARAASVLPQIIQRAGNLPAAFAVDGEAILPGRFYVAPPDRHLLVENGGLSLVHGPRENGHRPAVDPLFRTAALGLGGRLVGVVLSGSLDDGTIGLAAIKRAGGLTLVQHPEEALYRGMPESAIERVGPDQVLRVAEIAEVIAGLVPPEPGKESRDEVIAMETDPTQLHPEEITRRNEAAGATSRYTCPECSGTLWELNEGGLVKLRCRVGHTFTEEAFAAEHAQKLEAALWAAIAALEERADFSRRLAARFDDSGNEITSQRYRDQAANALEQVGLVRRALEQLASPQALDEREVS